MIQFATLNRIKVRYTGNYIKFDGDANNLHWLSVTFYNLYGPICIYSNGRSYVSTKTNPYTSNQRPGVVEYYNGNATLTMMDRDSDSEDRHDGGMLIDDGTGKITLLFEQHNPTASMGRVEVWKMATANDNTSWQYKGLSSEFGDYCKPYVISANEIICIGRRNPLSAGGDGNLYMVTYDNDTTWGAPVQITEHSGSPPLGTADDERYYPSCFQGHDVDSTWCYLMFSKRNGDSGSGIWYKEHFVLKFKRSAPFTIYNLSESYSKDISGGPISWADLLANFIYADNLTSPGGNSVGIISGSEIHANIPYQGTRTYFKYSGGWSNHGNVGNTLFPFDLQTGIYDDTVNAETVQMSEFIYGKGNKIFTPENGIWQITGPINYNKIPHGQNFAVAVGTLKNGNTSDINNPNENDIYILEMTKL